MTNDWPVTDGCFATAFKQPRRAPAGARRAGGGKLCSAPEARGSMCPRNATSVARTQHAQRFGRPEGCTQTLVYLNLEFFTLFVEFGFWANSPPNFPLCKRCFFNVQHHCLTSEMGPTERVLRLRPQLPLSLCRATSVSPPIDAPRVPLCLDRFTARPLPVALPM